MHTFNYYLDMSNSERISLNLKETKEALKIVGAEANDRYKELKKHRDLGNFPAIKFADKNGGFMYKGFTTIEKKYGKKQARNILQSELKNAIQFLRMESSTVKGVKALKKQLKDRYVELTGYKSRWSTIEGFFNLYDSLQEVGVFNEKEYYSDKQNLMREFLDIKSSSRHKSKRITEEMFDKLPFDKYKDIVANQPTNELKELAYNMLMDYVDRNR